MKKVLLVLLGGLSIFLIGCDCHNPLKIMNNTCPKDEPAVVEPTPEPEHRHDHKCGH